MMTPSSRPSHRAIGDLAVGGHAAAGPDDHDVADPQFGGRDGLYRVTVDTFGLIGQQRRQRVQRRRGLRQRPHLDPVAEKHDHDQQRQLPPEVQLVVQCAKARAPRRHKRHGDGQADQQHHSRCARTDFTDRSGQERSPAPEVHHGAEHRGHPSRAWHVRHGVAEDHREHAGERDGRDGEHEHCPEQAPELSDVIAVAAVALVTGMCRRCGGLRHRGLRCVVVGISHMAAVYPIGVYV
jgi:hypothetical protein